MVRTGQKYQCVTKIRRVHENLLFGVVCLTGHDASEFGRLTTNINGAAGEHYFHTWGLPRGAAVDG